MAHSFGVPDGDGEDWPEQLALRAAWCYHMLGLTQAQTAERLGIPRMRVNRLLAEARERGLVTISINSSLTENIELEEGLRERFGLGAVHVALAADPVATREDPQLARLLGRVAAPIVAALLRPGITIAVGWGITLKALAASFQSRSPRGVSVISLVGSLNRRSAIDTYGPATLMAEKLAAECFYLPAPLICDTAESRRTLVSQPTLSRLMQQARVADLAVLSVGGHKTGTVSQIGLIEEDELATLEAAGSVGNFLGHFIDRAAGVIAHPVNDRVVGVKPDELATIPRRIMISGGPLKVPALRAVLGAGYVTDLITDQDTARRLLDIEEKGET